MGRHRLGKSSAGVVSVIHLPSFLSGEALVEQSQDLGYIELDIFEVEVLLIVLLHFQQVIELQVEFEEAPISAYSIVSVLHTIESNSKSMEALPL